MSLAFLPGCGGGCLAWLLCCAGSYWSGYEEATARATRRHAVAAEPWAPSHRARWEGAAVLRITSWARQRAGGWEAAARVIAAAGEADAPLGGPARLDGVLLRGEGELPPLWTIRGGRLELALPPAATVSGGFDQARYLAGRGLLWQGRLVDQNRQLAGRRGDTLLDLLSPRLTGLRRWVIGTLERRVAPREAQVLSAVLIGEKGAAKEQRQVYTRLGLAHLFAVSGLHVGILLGVLAALLLALAPGPLARWLVVIGLLPVYCLLTGLPASVLRASGLAALALSGPPAGRRCQSLHVLGVLLWSGCQIAPWCVLDTGCRLSFLAAGGIVALHGATRPLLAGLRGAWGWLPAGLLVTVGAQWFTFTEIAASFGCIDPLSPLANLLAVPCFTAAVWCAAAGLTLAPCLGWAADALLAWSWLLLRLLSAAAGLAAAHAPLVGLPVPGPWRVAGWLLASGLLLGGLVHWSGRRSRSGPLLVALAVGLLAATGPVGREIRRGHMQAVQFDVDQGDCALLSFPDGWRVLVDTGGAWPGGSQLARTVMPWLRRQNIRRLDAVVLTHGHDDHTGGVADLLGALPVARWYAAGGARECPALTGRPILALRAGQVVHRCLGWSLRCLQAAEGEVSENDHSPVLALCRGPDVLGLWTGDLEAAGEEALLARRPASARRLQVWKAGHHGSGTSGCPGFLDWARPRLVLISCGTENRHRHPSHGPYVCAGDTMKLLRTDLDGSILLAWDGRGRLSWHTARGRDGRLPPP